MTKKVAVAGSIRERRGGEAWPLLAPLYNRPWFTQMCLCTYQAVHQSRAAMPCDECTLYDVSHKLTVDNHPYSEYIRVLADISH